MVFRPVAWVGASPFRVSTLAAVRILRAHSQACQAMSLPSEPCASARLGSSLVAASCECRRLTLPSSGQPKGCALRLPLMSNVGQMQTSALMSESSCFPVALSSQAERGGESIAGCAPFGLQRAVAAPRSNAAGLSRRVRSSGVARKVLQGEIGLFVTLGAASRFCSASPRKPNPAFERTAHGKPWSTAQGER